MRINDILMETQSNEGIVSDVATGVGKAVGATARGIGAVAGGVRGVGDAVKKGFQTGRAVVGGTSPEDQKIKQAHDLRAQADQLDGGNSAGQYSAPQGGGRFSRGQSGAGGQARPYTGGRQQTTTPQASAGQTTTPAATTSQPALDSKALRTSLQHVSGPDVERIRTLLKRRAGIAEGIVSSVAGGLGNLKRGWTNTKAAYQQARGGSMTPQEIDQAIASMPKEQAAELLQFFDTLHPATSAPATSAPATSAPAGATAGNPQSALLALGGNRPKPPPGTINGLATPNAMESRRFKFRSSFLGTDI